MAGRFGISDISPTVGSTTRAEYPARTNVGEPHPHNPTVFREGHDAVCATVVLRGPGGKKHDAVRMTPGTPGTDRWHASISLDRPGPWTFAVEAWSDPFATWHHTVTVKIDAGQGAEDLANDLVAGA